MINNQKKINHLNLLKNKNHVWKKKITSKQINQKKKKKNMSTRRLQSLPCKSKEKKKKERQHPKERKRKKEKKIWRRSMWTSSSTVPICPIFHFSFLSILGRKFFGRPEKKTPGSYHLFSFFSTQPNTIQKVFIFIFFRKFFIHPISLPNKHIGS